MPTDAERLALPPIDIVIVKGDLPTDRLIVGQDQNGAAPSVPWGPRLAALGWATVDTARAAAEFGRDAVGNGADDEILGARGSLLASGTAGGALRLVMLEPTTEGRVAAALARHGEGPVALYVEGVALQGHAGSIAATALGPGRLAWPSRVGPFIIVLER